MVLPGKKYDTNIEVVSLKLGDGWSGRAVLSTSADASISEADWIDCLAEPQWLFTNVDKTLKTEGQNCVVVKSLTIGGRRMKVIIKRHYPGDSIQRFFRSFCRGRALQNFDAALKLLGFDIPVVAPLAALQKRRKLLIEESIYITEYSEGSLNVYNFLSEKLQGKRVKPFKLKKQIGNQLASILAMLHKNGLWCRDSKATNFIVSKYFRGNCKVQLTDVDGIRPYLLRRKSCRFRSLWQLAASLLPVTAINRTDYFRAFTAYADLTGIEPAQRRSIFRHLIGKAEAKRRRSITKNILIIKPSSLGDIVMALPVLSALRRSFPDAKISWLVRTEFAPLIDNHPDLNETILFHRKFLGKAWYHPGAMVSLLLLIFRLRRGRFDAVIDLQGLFRTASLGWLSGCRRRAGMAGAREFAHFFYTHKVQQDSDCIHLVDYYLKIAQTIGVSPDIKARFVLPTEPDAVDSVNTMLKAHRIQPHKYAVIVPTSAHGDKCWPIERFAILADKITTRFDLSVIATGAASEKGNIDMVRSFAHVPIANFAGATSIKELVALLKGARLVVSNDTGPGHIAAALARPLVLIFGRSNPARVAPYGRPDSVAAVEPDGRGFKADSTDPKHNVKHVSIDCVYTKVCEQLK